MYSLANSLKSSISSGNWYGALFLALSLPDILGRIKYPNMSSQKRYSLWFKEYIQEKYTTRNGVHLSGNDCYALRCSALHEGSEWIEKQRAREIVKRFKFYLPKEGIIYHNNMFGGTLQLQVDIFCNDILEGVERFVEEHNISDELIIREITFGEPLKE